MDAKLVFLFVLLAAACLQAQPVGESSESAESMETRSTESAESTESNEGRRAVRAAAESDSTSSDSDSSNSSESASAEDVQKQPVAKRADGQLLDEEPVTTKPEEGEVNDKETMPKQDSDDDDDEKEEEGGKMKRRRRQTAEAANSPAATDDADNSTQTLYLIKTVTYEVGVVSMPDDNTTLVESTSSPVAEKEVVTIYYDSPSNASTEATPPA